MKAILFVFGAAWSISAFAGAPVANDITCEQTLKYSARHHRVYIRTQSNDVIPVYGYDRACSAGESALPYWVKTIDTEVCVIGHRCGQDG